jgi:2-dehydro-3-deoxygluconokinase
MAGLIYGLHTGLGEDETLAFAIAAAALKHSIPGDVNLATAEEIMRLVKEGGSGRVQR